MYVMSVDCKLLHQISNVILFCQAYGRDLMEAQEWCRKYQRSGNVKDLTQAWDLYYLVFRRISKQLPQVRRSLSHRLIHVLNCF